MLKDIQQSYQDSLALLRQFCSDETEYVKTFAVSRLIATTFQNRNKVLIAGNGGSACDAMHFAEEFTGKFRDNRQAFPVIAFTDPAQITAVGNDFGFDQIFVRNVEAYGNKDDVLIVISTSGNSPNIIKAAIKAKELDLRTIALLGKDGGKLKGCCDYEFIIPGNTTDKIQEIHMVILHILIEGVERILFPSNYNFPK